MGNDEFASSIGVAAGLRAMVASVATSAALPVAGVAA